MTDLSDINMDGVQPMSTQQELPVGQYLVRVEDTEKKATKERFDEAGHALPVNHYLQIAMQVYGGPNEGQIEFARLNLWNPNETAVRMAKAELKSIQEATGVASTNSDHYHGKWMVLEVKAGVKDPSKLYKNYSAAPEPMVAAYAHIPPVAAKAPSAVAQPAAAPVPAPAFVRNMLGAAAVAAAPAAAAPGALPSWAQKKTA